MGAATESSDECNRPVRHRRRTHAAGSRGADPQARLRTGVERLGRGVDDVKTGNIFQLFVAVLLLTAIGWLVFSMLNTRTDRDYPWAKAKIDEANIATALNYYSSI